MNEAEITRENYEGVCESIAFSEQITEEEKNSAITLAELWGKLGYEEAVEIYKGRFSSILKKKFGYCNSVSIDRAFDIVVDIIEKASEKGESNEQKKFSKTP